MGARARHCYTSATSISGCWPSVAQMRSSGERCDWAHYDDNVGAARFVSEILQPYAPLPPSWARSRPPGSVMRIFTHCPCRHCSNGVATTKRCPGLDWGAPLPHCSQISRGTHLRLGVLGGLRRQTTEDPDSLRSSQTHACRFRMFPELHADAGVAEVDPHVGLHELRHENGRPPEVRVDRLQLPKPATGVHDDRGVSVPAWDLGKRRGMSVPRDEDVYVPSGEVAAHRWPPVCRQKTSDLLLLSPRRRDALPIPVTRKRQRVPPSPGLPGRRGRTRSRDIPVDPLRPDGRPSPNRRTRC